LFINRCVRDLATCS